MRNVHRTNINPLFAAFAGAVLMNGCGSAGTGQNQLRDEQGANRGFPAATLNAPTMLREFEDNDTFAHAQTIPTDGTAGVPIIGQIDWVGDVDVFWFGPIRPDKGVLIELTGSAGALPMLAVFDASMALAALDQPVAGSWAALQPDLRTIADGGYVALACPFGEDCRDYELTATEVGTVDPVEPRPQIVVLSFVGAEAVPTADGTLADIPPFSAGQIDPALAGLSDDIREAVVELVIEDFAAFDVTIVENDAGQERDGPASVVHFGTYSPDMLGLAESVDFSNADMNDQAVVFVDTFSAFAELAPSADEVAQALANVASHEIGHLLGLVHTDNPDDLMDVNSGLDRLLDDRWFVRSRLDPLTFPIGQQDAPAVLERTVGGVAATTDRKLFQTTEDSTDGQTRAVGIRGRLTDRPLSTCRCWSRAANRAQ